MKRRGTAFYISSHGFGHMTRCLALIEAMLEQTDQLIYLAGGAFQNDFSRHYLKPYQDRVIYKDLQTDVGLVAFQNGLNIDKIETEKQLQAFTAKWESIVAEEVKQLQPLSIRCVVTDISPIGALVGGKLGVPTIGISNFTWAEQYEHYGIDPQVVQQFQAAYAHLTHFIAYALALLQLEISCPRSDIGFVARQQNAKKIQKIRETYGESLFISCGKSVNLDKIEVKNFDGTIFTTSGVEVSGSGNVVQLPSDLLDTQNYVATSRLVIAKAGWGTIAEAVTSGKKMLLIERPGVLEDTANIRALEKRKVAISLEEKAMRQIDIKTIKESLQSLTGYETEETFLNETNRVLELIMRFSSLY